MDEVLDLVNENDEIIGEVLKSKANADPKLLHREVGVFLHDKNGRVLLQQRSSTKKAEPGIWAIVAGHVTKGEDPAKAAHRELLEEMGFDTELTFVRKVKINRPKETHFSYLYVGLYSGEKLVLEKEEVEDARLFTKKEYLAAIKRNINVNKFVDSLCRDFWDGKIKI